MKEVIEYAAITIALFAVMALAVKGLQWVDERACLRRWAESGRASKYVPGVGCLVQGKDGYWTPAKNVREVSQ